MSKSRPPETCANCGATIPRGARACPECGADERTGWDETSIYDGLDLPAGYEGDEPRPARSPGDVPWYWIAIGALLLVALAALFVFR